ncbi:MAG: hypothetical protein J3R72DRAFT_496719 [Linnemannia gamsii]|nr:MAG: hypothetical protein J3R72DRAFT_496719 [Linnemannia gamsii]
MSEQPPAERRYNLGGDHLEEIDQGMGDVAITSDNESDTRPPDTRRPSLWTNTTNIVAKLPLLLRLQTMLTLYWDIGKRKALLVMSLTPYFAASEEDMVTNALLSGNEDSLAVLEMAYTTAENSAELEEAKSIALTALTRVKTLKATRRALLPAPALTAVPYDPVLPFHAAIKRYFKITDIPTVPKTGEVHWVSIGGLADKDAPVFNLESSLKKASADTLVTFVVRVRDWDYVKIINTDDVRHHVKALLFQLRIEHEEPALFFVTRVRGIIRMAKVQDTGHHLSELIFQALPTNGREMVNQEFSGGTSKLTDYDALLNFLSRTASAFHSRRAQPGIYSGLQNYFF